ncbi:radical SAM protein [Patescibacteria group bacterium]|nr:radical SAM protein [Patescibacteria group bacterium]
MELFGKKISQKNIDSLERYLNERFNTKSEKSSLGIVYDITYFCNLSCLGCAVNAKKIKNHKDIKFESSLDQVFEILNKIYKFKEDHINEGFFINFGGGEPFLRSDFFEILQETASLFGPKNIGIDTNGTLLNKEAIQKVLPLVNYLGISIDGLSEYHNHWRFQNKEDIFKNNIELINEILKIDNGSDTLEVSSVVTKTNIDQIPMLITYLNDIGVKKYSIHRAMPVGRFAHHIDLLPSGEDYLELLIIISQLNQDLEINIHMHHSIEAIYTSIFLGKETISKEKIGLPDKRSSIGIDPFGYVHFDPWCIVPPWNKLHSDSLLNESVTFESTINNEILNIINAYCSPEVRCNGCTNDCTGGSRIAAAFNYISENFDITKITPSHLLDGLSKKDPACPFFHEGGGN